ncbi:MAG: tetratricopeptide repeat protein [Acidobacteriia bacterium]|nr:tetratricopeptide repeat protein [Terriglobia bacterium]
MRAGGKDEIWIEVRTPHFLVSSNAGEKQARRVANQFEQIRAVFQAAFPKLRVDPGQPVLILAAKNENSLKALLPAFWEVKGSVHPAGIYTAGPEKHYVALRVDVSGENPYHTIYHEYTHALLNLNFRDLPAWLNEGLAEFYGNTTVEEKEVRLGQYDEQHLLLLAQERHIPIATLLQVDHHSPYYNESNRASVFYAESWALVHYLMLEPESRREELLKKFLEAFGTTGDQMAAAGQAFGDLKQFGKRLDGYVSQSAFRYVRMKAPAENAEKTFTVRALSPAESAALRGDFHLHMGRMREAKALLDQALELDPHLAAAHESLGFFWYRQGQMQPAAQEYAEAVRLDSHSFFALYLNAMLTQQAGRYDPETAARATSDLEKAIQINPNFAPAYATLSFFYLARPETKDKAFSAAKRAVELAPGELQYAINLGHILLALNRVEDAGILAQRILKAAGTPVEAAMAQSFASSVNGYEEYRRTRAERGTENATTRVSVELPEETEKEEPKASAAPAKAQIYSMQGRIEGLICSPNHEAALTLRMNGLEMHLHARDTEQIEYRVAEKESSAGANPCARWAGRMGSIRYTLTPGGSYDGEITAISFH